jgi:hypothetical protein
MQFRKCCVRLLDNVKALYRRAKAHGAVGNFSEARADFEKVKMLDPKLSTLVTREMHTLDEDEHKKEIEDRARYRAVLRANAKQFEPKDPPPEAQDEATAAASANIEEQPPAAQ